MFGGVGKPAGWASILVAGGLVLGGSLSANAADFGGDCCADLEERVAELEATTARKGNTKVKLTVYGQVNEAVMFWDDGFEQNAYVVTNDASRTRIGFKGGAKISDDLSANFRIEIGIRSASSKRTSQTDSVGENGFDLRHSWWNLKSKTYGTIQVGHTPTASQDITEINLAGTNSVGKYADVEDSGGGMHLRTTVGGLSGEQWRRLIKHTGDAPGEGDRRQAILYKSPEFGGFHFLAAYGGDDFWDVGVTYEGKVGEFEIEAGMAYAKNTDGEDDSATIQCVVDEATTDDADCESFAGSISIMHKSGVYGNFAAGWLKDNNVGADPTFAALATATGIAADDTSVFWATEVGLQKKWHPVGKTTVFGQYYDYQGGANGRTDIAGGDAINSFGATASEIFSSDVQMWGLGVSQDLSAASMKLYALYRHYEFDAVLTDGASVQDSNPLEDFDVLMSGAIIKF